MRVLEQVFEQVFELQAKKKPSKKKKMKRKKGLSVNLTNCKYNLITRITEGPPKPPLG